MSEEVQVKIDIAEDGSGWTLSQDAEPRTAYVLAEPEGHFGYRLAVPFNSDDERMQFDNNIVWFRDWPALKVTNIKERYLTE